MLFILLLNRFEQSISQDVNSELGRQSFTPMETAIGRDAL